MGREFLPPQYVYVPVLLVYGDLPRAIAVTGIRIWGLGYKHHYERTDVIPQERLLEICRVGRSQLYEHLGYLVATGMLRFTNINGEFTFFFDQPTLWRASPENRTDSTLSVVVDSNLSINASKQQQQDSSDTSRMSKRKKQPNPAHPDSSPAHPDWAERVGVLEKMGVLEPVRSELATLVWATGEYLEAWADWQAVQEGVGVGVVVLQIRAGVVAPRLTREQRKRRDVREWAAEVVKR